MGKGRVVKGAKYTTRLYLTFEIPDSDHPELESYMQLYLRLKQIERMGMRGFLGRWVLQALLRDITGGDVYGAALAGLGGDAGAGLALGRGQSKHEVKVDLGSELELELEPEPEPEPEPELECDSRLKPEPRAEQQTELDIQAVEPVEPNKQSTEDEGRVERVQTAEHEVERGGIQAALAKVTHRKPVAAERDTLKPKPDFSGFASG